MGFKMCRMAELHQNNVWTTYYFINPDSKKMDTKIGFILRVPDTDYYVGSGIYNVDHCHADDSKDPMNMELVQRIERNLCAIPKVSQDSPACAAILKRWRASR